MFALIADKALYFKIDATNVAQFERAGCLPFVCQSAARSVQMSYWSAPAESLESPADARLVPTGLCCGIESTCRQTRSTFKEEKMKLLIIWMLNALALIAVASFVPGIHVDGFVAALAAAFLLGLVNTLIRPLLLLLTLPVTLLTLGLFIFVINGTLFWFVGSVLRGFVVDSFWHGVLGAVLYSIFTWALSAAAAQLMTRKS